MDLKNLEKMFEVMVSLEPPNTQKSNLEKCEFNNERYQNIKIENSTMNLKPRKPSLPLAVSAPSARRGSVDTRKSLFYNERNQTINKFNKGPLFRAQSRDALKVQPEMTLTDEISEDLLEDNIVPTYYNDSNIYDTISILLNDEDIEIQSTDSTLKNDRNGDTLSTLPNDKKFFYSAGCRGSVEKLNNDLKRYSHLSDNTCNNRCVEDNERNTGLQSAPESARNSTRVESMYSKENQSSIDSGVDQQVSINLSSCFSNEANNSNESFSDISESNIYIHSDKDLFCIKNDPPDRYVRMTTPSKSLTGSDQSIKNDDTTQLRSISTIAVRSEEDKEKYLRLISLDMSSKSLSPKAIITFVTRDGQSTSQVIDKYQTAASVCAILKKKFNKPEDSFWQILEVIEKESLERPLEDHENIFDIFSSWENDNICNRFIFQENQSMYKIFMQPNSLNNDMKIDYEISDTLWMKKVYSKWVYTTCFISDSNIFYTLKRGSKSRHDQYHFVNLKEVDFYTSSNPKKLRKDIKSQTNHIIVFKTNKLDHRCHESNYLAALNNQQKDKWIDAIKVAKFSFNQLKNNYLENQMCFPTGFRSQANSTATIDGTFNPVEAFVT